jgi:predicted phage baseplate assembly protein
MKPKVDGVARVTNPRPAVGGADAETIDHARRFGPLAFRSGDRAVTLADFVTLARQAGGVAKVRARSTGWNRIDLFVAAEGDVFAPAPPETKQKLVAFFENRRMVGTSVRIQDPVAVPIDIAVEVWVEHHRDPAAVLAEVRTAVGEIVAYRNVDFGRPLYLSKVYEAVEALRGVAAANVSTFGRRDRLKLSTVVAGRLERLGLGNLTRTVDEIVSGAVPTYGRIEIGEFEIPVAGTITVTQAEGAGPAGTPS